MTAAEIRARALRQCKDAWCTDPEATADFGCAMFLAGLEAARAKARRTRGGGGPEWIEPSDVDNLIAEAKKAAGGQPEEPRAAAEEYAAPQVIDLMGALKDALKPKGGR